jgi:exopolysaccharide production protein ExoZ
MSRNNEQFEGIQALRFIAALMVVVTHSTFYVSERLVKDFPVWSNGASGVDVFFVISGFVMVISSQSLMGRDDGWKQFMLRRLLRIVPLYWVVTTIKLVAMLAVPAVVLHAKLDLWPVVSSYLFLPSFNADGNIEPLLGVGWTLNFEMFFYSLFAIAMALRVDVFRMVTGVFVVCCIAAFFRTESWPAATFYFNTIVLEFAFGMLLARAVIRGFSLPVPVSLFLLIVGFIGLLIPWGDVSGLWRPLKWGLPAVMIVTAVIALNPLVGKRIPKSILELGDASYALYLFHPLIAPIAPTLLAKLGLPIAPLSIAVSIVSSIVATWIIFRIAERPTTEFLKRRLAAASAHGTSLKPADPARTV